MYCVKCGHELDDDARFCTACGASVGDAADETTGDAQQSSEMSESSMGIEPKLMESADSSGDPISFSDAMEKTKARSKHHIPIAVIVALVLALAAGTAFASYYVYVAVVEPMIEEASEQSDSGSNEDVGVDEDDTEADALAAYDVIFGEYREFAEYVANGGSPADLTIDEEGRWTDFPDVATVNSSSYSPGEEIRYQYAYRDFDGDGISELLVGTPHSIDDGISLFQMFTYQNGETKELFQSKLQNRSQYIDEDPYFDLTTNGYIKSVQGTGGSDDGIATYTVYALGNGELQETASFAYRIHNGDTSGLVTIWEDGEERQVSSEESTALLFEFDEAYPWPGDETVSIDDSSLGDWQDLQ